MTLFEIDFRNQQKTKGFMESIPNTEDSLVLRTDFSDEAAWNLVCSNIKRPVGEFQAYVEFLSNSNFEGLTSEQIIQLIPESYEHSFIFIVDKVTISHLEHPVLVVDLFDEPGRIFRVIPSRMYSSICA